MGKGSQLQAPTVLNKEKDPPATTECEAGRTHSLVRAGNPTTVPQSLQPVQVTQTLSGVLKRAKTVQIWPAAYKDKWWVYRAAGEPQQNRTERGVCLRVQPTYLAFNLHKTSQKKILQQQ